MKPPEKALVCALADDSLACAGSTFDHACRRCKARVMVAPSGRAALSKDPEIVVLCMPCARILAKRSNKVSIALAAPLADIVRDMKSAGPKPWRKRN